MTVSVKDFNFTINHDGQLVSRRTTDCPDLADLPQQKHMQEVDDGILMSSCRFCNYYYIITVCKRFIWPGHIF